MAAMGRVETATVDSQRPRTDVGAGSLSPAINSQSPSDPDSGQSLEPVCYLPACQIGRIDSQDRRMLFFLPCYSVFREWRHSWQ